MAALTVRRYYLGKRRDALALGDKALSYVWRSFQEAPYWPDLPADFPGRTALVAGGYTTVRDLDGATEDELVDVGLSRSDAAAALVAMESWAMITTAIKTWVRQDGRTASALDLPLAASATRTATGTGDTAEMGEKSCMRLKLDVTAVSGSSPTLDVIVETSPDGASNWQTVATFAQKSAVSSELNVFPGCDRFVRAKWTIAGTTPSFTFSLLGEAV